MAGEIKPLFPLLCCDVPSVYSNKQSYYECLCYIGYKVNECIETLNTFTDSYKKYTDEKVNALRDYVDTLNSSTRKYIDDINNKIREDMTAKDDELDKKIDDVNTYLSLKISELNVLIYKLNSETRKYINDEIEKVYDFIKNYIPEHIVVLNPVKGYNTSLNMALSDLYDSLRYFALTCNEFDTLNLTCAEFDGLYLSAYDFDLYGAKKFRVDSNLYMHDPFTGEYTFYQNVINKLAELHFNNPITASNFDGLLLSASEFDAKSITAYNFDSNANTILRG